MTAARAKKKVAPAPRKATHQLAKATADSSLYRAEDGYSAPAAEDRRKAQLLDELHTLGYGIWVRCKVCNRPLTAPSSVRRHQGRVCARRAVVAE